MDFIDQLKQFSKRVESIQSTISTEEATKTAIVMPFFSMLGYDVFNPQEFVPEFTADVGIKKGEKVDYAIVQDGEPVILIECKSITENLEKHDSQLFRYFGTTSAKFAILTNGVIYRFYTDLDDPNKMDEAPFLSVNILEIRDNQVPELKKFCKACFDVDSIFSTASELKYANEFKALFTEQLETPSDDFVRFFLQSCYTGQKTQNVIEKFRPILRKALNVLISEMMNDKIKSALGGGDVIPASVPTSSDASDAELPEDPEAATPKRRGNNIITTEEELEAYFIVKNMLKDVAEMSDITYKDTESYFNILYKANTRKWICRLKLTENQKVLMIPDEEKNISKIVLFDVYEILDYKEQLVDVLTRYM